MFEIVGKFENAVADFYGSPYAIAVDSCTHALELCLRASGTKSSSCPTHTYISIPFTFIKLGIDWKFDRQEWHDFYYLGNTNIIDAAVHWQAQSYVPGTMMCLSFQFQKQLNLIRGGAILVDDLGMYKQLKKMSYDGRLPNVPWKEQKIDTIGYHYYMPPETAQLGLDKLPAAILSNARSWSWLDYPYLPDMPVFKDFVI